MIKKIIGIAVALLLLAAFVPGLNAQTNLLTEDFESSFPPSGWGTSVTGGNNQWFRNDYWPRANNTPGANGFCAANDDDRAGSGAPRCQNNRLTSPAFDASGYTTVSLAFDLNWNDIGSRDEAFVEVYDGSSWTEVVRYGGDSYMRDSIDITADVNGATDAQVRFVYHETNTTWAWWFQVDDVDVWGATEEPDPVDSLMCDDFNGSWLPAGWTTTNDGGGQQWFRNDAGASWRWSYTNRTNGDGYCAANDDDWHWSYPVNNALTSPAFDATGYTNVTFTYEWYGHHTWSGNDWCNVEVYDGSNWQLLNQHINWSTGAASMSFPIGAIVGGVTDAQVRFSYTSTSWMYGIQIDNPCVTALSAGGELNLELTQIVRPYDVGEEGGVAFRPACKIYSNLDDVIAKVTCKIRKVSGGGYIYEDALNSVPLDAGYNDVDAFKYFTPEGNTKYNVLFVVEHPDDIDDSNNDKDKNFTTALGMDVTPTAMLSPEADQYNAFSPSATFEERAGQDVGAYVHCTIEDATYHAVVYHDSVVHDFRADDTWNGTFAEVTGLADGSYTITFWAEDTSKGNNISNPELVETFAYTAIAESPVVDCFSLDVTGTKVNFSLANATNVSIRVYDISGKAVATLVSESRDAGSYTVDWNTAGIASGVYFVKMVTSEFDASSKLVLLR